MPEIEFTEDVLEHRPSIFEAWKALDAAFVGADSTLPFALKEEVRKVIAENRGCELCASIGGARKGAADIKESLAVAFAEAVLDDHTQVDSETFAVLREEFSDEQIVELSSWIVFKLAATTLGSIVGLDPATEEQMAAFRQYSEQAAAVSV